MTPRPGNVPADEFDPERILRIFADHGVDCLIVGGFGAQAHGVHRQTLDIDVVPRSTDANLERLAAALRDLGARLRVGGLTDDEARALPVTVDAATLRSFVSSTWMTDAGPVDVLGDLPIAGGRRGYEEMVERAVPRSIRGFVVRIASLDDIIASKEHADRDKDRQALPELRELQRRQRAGEPASE